VSTAVVIVIIVVIAVLLVGGGTALLVARRRDRTPVAGEPRGTPAAAAPTRSTPTVETPTVEELEALLETPAPVVEKPRLRDRLGRTRSAFTGAFGRMRGRKVDAETWDELEEALLLADVGMTTTTRLLDAVRTRAKEASVTEPDDVVALIRDEVVLLLDGDGADR